MKRLYSTFLFFLLVTRIFAQSDSLALANGSWQTHKLKAGATWKTVRFYQNELFGANQNISIIQVPANQPKLKLVLVHSDSLETTSQMALKNRALAGVNGSYFKMRGPDPDYDARLTGVPKMEPAKLDHNRSVVYMRENGQVISPNAPAKPGVRKRHQQGTLAITDHAVSILKGDSLNLAWEQGLNARDVLSAGPLMLLAGKNLPIPNDAFCNDRHPRTAVGIRANGTILLLVVDGRTKESAGMSIPELQKIMRWLGCVDAINMDGGGSSTLYVKKQPDNGVVNYPTDNKKFDHAGERGVANAILLLKN